MKTKPPAPRKKAQLEFPRLTGDPVETLVFILAAIGFWVIALTFLATELVPSVWYAHASATSWRKTEGRIIQAEWKYKRSIITGKSFPRRARIVYRYSVDGREFESSKVELLEAYTYSIHREHMQRYPEGSQVTVYYQPEDPANAALRPGFRRSALVVVLFAFACLFGTLYFTARGSWIAFERYRLRSLKLPSEAV